MAIMLNLQEAIRKVISRFIVNETPLTVQANPGDTTLTIASSRRYECGDPIVIYKPDQQGQVEGQLAHIVTIPDNETITIDVPIEASLIFPATTSNIQKQIGDQAVNGIYLGDPAVIPMYPAITVDAKTKTSEWMTLESTSETYNIDITVYVEETDYEKSYKLMHYYAEAIENALWRSLYPLVQPYDFTTLVEDASPTDTIIKVAQQDLLLCAGAFIFLESFDFLRPNRVVQYLGNGVYELAFAAGQNFPAGSLAIRPRENFYNSIPATVTYGTVNKNTLLKAAVISYNAQREARRFTPKFIDSLIV